MKAGQHVLLVMCTVLTLTACKEEPKGFNYGPDEERVRLLRKRLASLPCDPSSGLELAKVMQKAGDLNGVVEQARKRREACKSSEPALLKLEYDVFMELKDYAGAVETASLMVQQSPMDAASHLLRAKANENKGDAKAAALELRQLYATIPKEPGAGAELARVYERMGKKCEAAITWTIVGWFSNHGKTEAKKHLAKLSKECPELTVKGQATLNGKAGKNDWLSFPLKLSNGKTALFTVDDNAPYTVINKAVAERAGLAPEADTVSFKGFFDVKGNTVRIPSLSFGGGLEVKNVDAVVMDKLPDDLEGVLGADVLARVALEQDGDRGKFSARTEEEE